MATITENLNKIWSEFRKVGITDDLVVIEYLARLLLEKVLDISIDTMVLIGRTPTNNKVMGFLTDHPPQKILPSEPSSIDIPHIDTTNIVSMSTLPRHPQDIPNLNLQSIQENLDNAINQAENIPNLYNHHILFRLSTRQSGGRYPTPRHITKFIYNLAQVKPDHSLADFACGSGGFLVERELTVDNYHKTWGIDISPEWIRLAYTNIALRKLPPLLRSGNALDVETFNKLKFKQKEYTIFDRILMNPPFGEKIDTKLAVGKLGKTVGSRSETALTTLAIQQLAEDGIAAILVPSGLLFSNSKAEKELRQTLIDEYHLKAVLTLPKDALQPYSSLQSHILLIHKIPPLLRGVRGDSPLTGEKMTWFFQLEKDGYSSGRSRDLTQKPNESDSNFPFVESVFNRQKDEFDYSFLDSHPKLGIKIFKNNENQLLGVVIQGLETTEINSITFYPQVKIQQDKQDKIIPPFLLVDTIPIENQKLCIRIPLDENQPDIVKNPLQLIQDLFKPKKNDPDPGYRLYSTAVKEIAIAIYPDTIITKESIRVLGVLIPSKQIIDKNYDLRPEEYINKQTETLLSNSPVELLTRIYTNQRQLTQNLETLFSRIELPPISTQKLPSPIAETFIPFGQLNPQQQDIWDKIQSQTQPYTNDEGENYKIALHFIPQDIEIEDNGEISDTTQRTLELLDAMGVIIPVTIDNKLYYRRVTQRDLWTNSD
ncbi:N-6 DNA methylase [Gloeothece citriformis PCC 7424]|uniref:site-specific DNA-methyltransferase (adenine-specific) n=1 Tax=Gloeothece citriformis (strain PCC 7424) TaxID=65393 RepID=B7KF56_GLOC7|nr:N-6 DNA methylase [Gloeothece citriformis]ACK70512.1 N-6 DNA methylase [Gloeothece citriformis PCC 7424]